MPVPLPKIREIVFQMLYSYDLGESTDENMIELLMKELAVTKKTVKDAQQKVHQIREKLQKIDRMIAETSLSYSFERIQTVERNILRLGIYEIFFDDSIPPKVAIAEAVRLARKFGTKESATFVNAILDTLYKASIGEKIDPQHLHKTSEDLTKSEQIAQEASQQPKESKKT
jgi:transcription antitermination protein NusB